MNVTKKIYTLLQDILMKMSALMAERCNSLPLSLSRVVNIVYSCFIIMYCCT